MLNVGMTSLPYLSFIDAKSVFDTLLRFHNDTILKTVRQETSSSLKTFLWESSRKTWKCSILEADNQ